MQNGVFGVHCEISYSEKIRAINETPHYFLNDPMSRPYRNTEMKVLKRRRKKHPSQGRSTI